MDSMTSSKFKIQTNKKNNQLSVFLNRKQLDLKGKTPKFLKIDKKDLEY